MKDKVKKKTPAAAGSSQFMLAKLAELDKRVTEQDRKMANMAAAMDRVLREVSTVYADNDKTLQAYIDDVNDRLMGLGTGVMDVWLELAKQLTEDGASVPLSVARVPVLTDRFITVKANECRLQRIEAMRKAGIIREKEVPIDTKPDNEPEEKTLEEMTQQQLIVATERIDPEVRSEYPSGATFFGGDH